MSKCIVAGCDKVYSTRRGMLLHARSHKYSCALCDKMFTSKCDLARHVNGNHNGDRTNVSVIGPVAYDQAGLSNQGLHADKIIKRKKKSGNFLIYYFFFFFRR